MQAPEDEARVAADDEPSASGDRQRGDQAAGDRDDPSRHQRVLEPVHEGGGKAGSRGPISPIRAAKMAPITATPSTPPVWRKVVTTPEATPALSSGTQASTAALAGSGSFHPSAAE